MDRENYSRVTDVLGALSGIDRVPKQILEPAADRGTRVHKAIDGEIQGIGGWIEEDIKGYVESYKLWLPHVKKEVIATERRYWDDQLQITGQIDLLCVMQGQTWLVDFKTSSKPQVSWPLQMSAYKHLAKIDSSGRIAVVHLKKDGSVPDILEYDNRFELFLECLTVYKYFYKNGKRIPYDLD